MSDQGLSIRRDQEPTTRPIDLVTVMGAAITVLGLFSIYIQVVAMAKDNRNLLLGVGVPVNGLSDHHKSMLLLDWIFLWLGASLGAIVFGLLFLLGVVGPLIPSPWNSTCISGAAILVVCGRALCHCGCDLHLHRSA